MGYKKESNVCNCQTEALKTNEWVSSQFVPATISEEPLAQDSVTAGQGGVSPILGCKFHKEELPWKVT